MGVSDIIAGFINEVLESENGCAELQRSALAQRFKCVPSQINYVISTRFSPEHGYIVESRRGGGGFIRISRVHFDTRQLIAQIVGAIGDEIDLKTTRAYLSNLQSAGLIDEKSEQLMLAALGEGALKCLSAIQRDSVRACIFKQMLLQCLNQEE